MHRLKSHTTTCYQCDLEHTIYPLGVYSSFGAKMGVMIHLTELLWVRRCFVWREIQAVYHCHKWDFCPTSQLVLKNSLCLHEVVVQTFSPSAFRAASRSSPCPGLLFTGSSWGWFILGLYRQGHHLREALPDSASSQLLQESHLSVRVFLI